MMTQKESLNLRPLYENAYSLFKEGQYKQAEEQLLELAYQSLDQLDYSFYLDVSLLLNRVYINSMHYKLLGNNLFTQNVYITEYANEEQKLMYRLHTAVFNHYFKIGNTVTELEELFEDVYTTSYYQLTASTVSYLMLVYLEMRENEKAIQLVQKTNSFIKKFHFDNPVARFAYLIYAFFAYFGLRMYKESAATLSEIEQTASFKQLAPFSPMYNVTKALQIAQSGKIDEAKKLFDKSYETMINKEHFRLALCYWVEILIRNGLYKEATFYQELHIKILENLYSTEISSLRKQVIEKRSKQSYEHLAFQDSLTGVYNRNYYESLTKRKIKFKHYTVIMLDLDFFKDINDTGGHPKGDEAIQRIARVLKNFINQYPGSHVIRYGGDEFILCMPYTYSNIKDALSTLHSHILSQSVVIHGNPFYLSISMGIGYTEKEYSAIHNLFELADAALYEAKRKRGVIVSRCIHS